jgi:hypothetical protein
MNPNIVFYFFLGICILLPFLGVYAFLKLIKKRDQRIKEKLMFPTKIIGVGKTRQGEDQLTLADEKGIFYIPCDIKKIKLNGILYTQIINSYIYTNKENELAISKEIPKDMYYCTKNGDLSVFWGTPDKNELYNDYFPVNQVEESIINKAGEPHA